MTTQDNTQENDIELQPIISEEKDNESDTARYKINTYGADFTLELLSKKIDEEEIIIPPFQRRYVWPIKKASKLIESFLLGLPVPQIFLYREEETQDLLVVDGQQRLKTVNFFFKGIFDKDVVFKLTGVREEWEGKTFDDLPPADKRKLNNYILRANIFEQTDPQDNSSIFEIFERLNTGGMALNQQEVRNCVIRGNISDYLKELNQNDLWRTVLNKPHPDTRMKDVELILRFLALYEQGNTYKKPMKDFISKFMEDNKHLDETNKDKYRQVFFDCIKLINDNIERPFRLKAGINIAIFDSVMVAIATIGSDKVKNLNTNYAELLKDESYLRNISDSTTDADRVKGRIETAIKFLSR